MAAFIDDMKAALRENAAAGQSPPVERRLLSTVASECGSRATGKFRDRLQKQLRESGIHANPPLTDIGLRLKDWVRFSTESFPPDTLLFSSEKHLQKFVEACLGSGDFRNLRLYKGDRGSGREFRLPDGGKIDLLCEEITRSGPGALVAIELKREQQRGTLEQVIGYLDDLKLLFPGRSVRGIIVSGREDEVAASMLRTVTVHRIDWYCYHVKFGKVQH